jgi:ABC-type dipeptide/oligopeptide/nickel transport system permease component
MTDQLKLMVGASGAILGLIVGIGIGLIVNSSGGEPSRPVSTSLVVVTTSIPRATTTDAPIAAAP